MKKIGALLLIITLFHATILRSFVPTDLNEKIEDIFAEAENYANSVETGAQPAVKQQIKDRAENLLGKLSSGLKDYFNTTQRANIEDRNIHVQGLQDIITKFINEMTLLETDTWKNKYPIEFQYTLMSSQKTEDLVKNLQELINRPVLDPEQDNREILEKTLGALIYYLILIKYIGGFASKESLNKISQDLENTKSRLAITNEDINTELEILEKRIEQSMPNDLYSAMPLDKLDQYLTYMLQALMQLNPFILHEEPIVPWIMQNIMGEVATDFYKQLSDENEINYTPGTIPVLTMSLEAKDAHSNTLNKIAKTITDATTDNTIINGQEILDSLDNLDIKDEEKINYKFLKEKIAKAIKIEGVDINPSNIEEIALSEKYLGISDDTDPIGAFYIGISIANNLNEAIGISYNLLKNPIINNNINADWVTSLETTDAESLWAANYINPTKKYLKFALEYNPGATLTELEGIKSDFDAFEKQIKNLALFKAFIQTLIYKEAYLEAQEEDKDLELTDLYLGTALNISVALEKELIEEVKKHLTQSYEGNDIKPLQLKNSLKQITEKNFITTIYNSCKIKPTGEIEIFCELIPGEQQKMLNQLINDSGLNVKITLYKQNIIDAMGIFGILSENSANLDDLRKIAESHNPENYQYGKAIAQIFYDLEVKAHQILTAPNAPANLKPLQKVAAEGLNLPQFYDQLKQYLTIAVQVKDGLSEVELNKLKADLENLENSLGNNKNDFIAFIQGLKYKNIPEIYLMDTINRLLADAGPQMTTEELTKLLNTFTIDLIALSKRI